MYSFASVIVRLVASSAHIVVFFVKFRMRQHAGFQGGFDSSTTGASNSFLPRLGVSLHESIRLLRWHRLFGRLLSVGSAFLGFRTTRSSCRFNSSSDSSERLWHIFEILLHQLCALHIFNGSQPYNTSIVSRLGFASACASLAPAMEQPLFRNN